MKQLETAKMQQATAQNELAALQEDAAMLRDLFAGHQNDLSAAEAAWKTERQPAQLDVMVQLKAKVEAVRVALSDQEHEVSKATAYLASTDAAVTRAQGIERAVTLASQLGELQRAHGEGWRALEATIVTQFEALLTQQDEWTALHQETVELTSSLTLLFTDLSKAVAETGADAEPLALVVPVGFQEPAPYERPYVLPLTNMPQGAGEAGLLPMMAGNALGQLYAGLLTVRFQRGRQAEIAASAARNAENQRRLDERLAAEQQAQANKQAEERKKAKAQKQSQEVEERAVFQERQVNPLRSTSWSTVEDEDDELVFSSTSQSDINMAFVKDSQ